MVDAPVLLVQVADLDDTRHADLPPDLEAKFGWQEVNRPNVASVPNMLECVPDRIHRTTNSCRQGRHGERMDMGEGEGFLKREQQP